MRLDLLLCRLRFVKSRSRAASLIETGRLRIDGQRIEAIDRKVHPGAVLTLPLKAGVRVIRLTSLPVRRGPPAEAAACYEEL